MGSKPIIYRRAEDTGITPKDPDMFGALGEIRAVTFHHSAGPRARTKAQAMALHRSYQAHHIAQGWGDIGYHFSIDDAGRVYVLRSHRCKGAHVGGWNTGNVGVMVHGNYETDRLTRAQRKTLRWLFTGGFFVLTGEREADIALVRGHNEWPGHGSNACPGKNLERHLRWLRDRHFH